MRNESIVRILRGERGGANAKTITGKLKCISYIACFLCVCVFYTNLRNVDVGRVSVFWDSVLWDSVIAYSRM